ncbi:MAG: hypothetical protein SVG88_06235 [Halobacteriales archaeon]|nr:hypothetical protein [Halobacteriales archaeon]
MATDRIEELEEEVRELRATVRGLTEELVDANERIRELEELADEGTLAANGLNSSADNGEVTATDTTPAPAADDADADAAGADETAEGEESTETEDDIIVA